MLTEKKRKLLIEFVDNKCEICHKVFTELNSAHIHRIKRGYQGGKYILRNIMIICHECHKNIHYREF